VPNQGSTVGGGRQPFFALPETDWVRNEGEMGRCHGEAARSILARVRGGDFAHFHAVAAKHHSRTQNSQFGLLGLVLCATTTAV
jgi:hypothetical protein